jgi:O-antigen ligase
MRLALPRPSLDKMNRLFMGPVVTWTAVIGSATSFLVIGAMLWGAVRLARGDFPPARSRPVRWIAFAFAMFFAVEAFCGLISFNGERTVAEIAENVVFLAFLPVYSRLAMSERNGVRNAIETSALAGAGAAFVLAIVQIAVLHIRAEGGAGNAVPFAIASLVTLTVTLLACLRADGRRRLLFALASLAAAACVVLSGTRSLWPGLVVVPAVTGFIYRRHVNLRHFGRIAAAMLAAAGVIGLLAAGFIDQRVSTGLKDFAAVEADDYSGSLGQRLVVWKIGLALFQQAPLLGEGPGNAERLLQEGSQKLTGTKLDFSHFHDVFLNYAVRDGIPGILMILGLILVPPLVAARYAVDELGAYGLALIVSVEACYLLSGLVGLMFGQDIFDSLFVISILAGVFLVLGADDRKDSESRDVAP